MSNKEACFTSNSDEWETPNDLYKELNEEFCFTIDVAANWENAKCNNYYTKDNNGLEQSWYGEVAWCNPPYSEWKKWVEKMINEIKINKGRDFETMGVFLLPARTDTIGFHKYIWDRENNRTRPGVKIRFIKGRLKFSESKNSAPFPSMIIIFK
jgi:site-specific DNA-methyltransferase (adenine-specific)